MNNQSRKGFDGSLHEERKLHHHPHGRCFPSEKDKIVTGELKKLLLLAGVDLKDHIIVSDYEAYSFAEHDLI